jgi:hypothetical protein
VVISLVISMKTNQATSWLDCWIVGSKTSSEKLFRHQNLAQISKWGFGTCFAGGTFVDSHCRWYLDSGVYILFFESITLYNWFDGDHWCQNMIFFNLSFMIFSEGPQNSDDLIITDDFTWKQMCLKRSESKSLTDSNWPSSISVLGRSLFVIYLCLPQKRFYIMANPGFCFILEKYKFMQWMGWYSKWPQGLRICGLISHLWWSTRHSRG